MSCKMIRYKQGIKTLTINRINPAEVHDGTYEGYYDLDLVKARVNVTVSDGKITDITVIEHVNGRGEPAEAILKTVMDAQDLSVAVVSGATASSKAILKAIENALKQGL